MALGTTTAAAVAINDRSEVSRPCQLTSFWQVINDDAKSQDNSGTPNPYSDSLSSTPVIMTIPYGTTLRLAARYTASGSMSTDPVVQVFGRSVNPAGQQDNTETTNTGTVGAWQQIVNKAGGLDITLSDASTDISDGSFEYTLSDLDAHSFDLDGNNQVLVLVKTAAVGPTNVDILGKVI